MTRNPQAASSSRYFYTDPLAAAWMAKHFGMDVRIDCPDGERFLDAITTHGVNTFGGAIAANNYTRFYIHPDSLLLLEPQVGDALQLNDKPYIISLIGYEIERLAHRKRHEKARIILRNGIPFMWPESEPLPDTAEARAKLKGAL